MLGQSTSTTRHEALGNISCKVSHLPPTVKAWVQSAHSPRGICGRLNGTGTHFSKGTSVFSGQDHSSNVPYSLIHQSPHNISITVIDSIITLKNIAPEVCVTLVSSCHDPFNFLNVNSITYTQKHITNISTRHSTILLNHPVQYAYRKTQFFPNLTRFFPTRVIFKKKAAQKWSKIIIIEVHKFLFLTQFITDIRTVVTTLLFTTTVLTSAPLRARLVLWGCLGDQEPTRDLQTFCSQLDDYQHHIHVKTSHTWLCKLNTQCQKIRPINAAQAPKGKTVEAFHTQEIQFYSPRPPIIPTQGFLLVLEQSNCTRNTAISECRSDPSHEQYSRHFTHQVTTITTKLVCKLLSSSEQSVKDVTVKVRLRCLVKYHTTQTYREMEIQLHAFLVPAKEQLHTGLNKLVPPGQ